MIDKMITITNGIKRDIMNDVRDRKNIFTFFATLLCFFLVHAGFFSNRYINEDFAHSLYGYSALGNIRSGRFFGNILFENLNSWTLGVVAAVLLSISVMLIISMFNVKNKIVIVLVSGFLVTFPGLAHGFTYLHEVTTYSYAIFFAVLAVYVSDKWKYGFIIGGIMLMFSMGKYQSYIGVAIVLCFGKVLFDIMSTDKKDKEVIEKLVKYLVMGIIGVVLYFIVLKTLLAVFDMELNSYKGIDSMGKISLEELPQLLYKTYYRFFGFFIGTSFFKVTELQKVLYIMYFGVFIITVVRVINASKSKIRGLIGIVLLGVTPIACNIIDFITPKASASVLNVYQFAIFIMIPLLLMNTHRYFRSRIYKVVVCVGAIAFTYYNAMISSEYYLKVATIYEYTSNFENRLYTRIESFEGYEEGMPIAIISDSSVAYADIGDNKFENIINETGFRANIVGLKYPKYYQATNMTVQLMKNILGVSIKGATVEQIENVLNSDQYKELGKYPSSNSMNIIDGILVINFVDLYKVDSQVEGNTIRLMATSYSKENNASKTAWYVYVNGKKVEELGRWYEDGVEFELRDLEPATYMFTCFIRDAENNPITMVSSQEIVIE